MANKLITMDQLSIVKSYIDSGDAQAIKSAEYADNTIKLYTSADKSGTAAVELSLPEEMFLDQAKTKFVASFSWSDAAYPGSTDPSLNGKPVLVLAVKGDAANAAYSFVSLEKLIDIYTGESTNTATVTVSADNKISAEVKISAETGNTVVAKTDGIFVPAAEEMDITGKADKLTTASNGQILVDDGSGNLKGSGKTIAQISDDINTAKSAVVGTASDTSAADTVHGAKKYADSLVADGSALDTRIDALETSVGGITYATDAEVKTVFGITG